MNKGKPKPAIVNPLPRKKVILAVGILPDADFLEIFLYGEH
ncbi:fosmidomycin resistance protein [Klebsiella pneumoniae]|uniref:Fosmidomycin resistance protein n=1 Tax=Klebsiella pneumoniae TaxID=573 RepID=A0A2X3CAN4_KLEPN|nr:fosmidomycin resistance protein [Klebsiella pneumoniae]